MNFSRAQARRGDRYVPDGCQGGVVLAIGAVEAHSQVVGNTAREHSLDMPAASQAP